MAKMKNQGHDDVKGSKTVRPGAMGNEEGALRAPWFRGDQMSETASLRGRGNERHKTQKGGKGNVGM